MSSDHRISSGFEENKIATNASFWKLFSRCCPRCRLFSGKIRRTGRRLGKRPLALGRGISLAFADVHSGQCGAYFSRNKSNLDYRGTCYRHLERCDEAEPAITVLDDTPQARGLKAAPAAFARDIQQSSPRCSACARQHAILPANTVQFSRDCPFHGRLRRPYGRYGHQTF